MVICAHNEATNLHKNLPKILIQDYPKFEVLVVDDASSDESAEILRQLQVKYPQLRVLHLVEKKGKGKKAALLAGLQQSTHDWLLLTDADAQPASQEWIAGMMAARSSSEKKIVLGYGPYLRYPTWINRWIRFETHYTALQYFAAATWGIPYMGVGRNLLYQKDLFKQYAYVFHQHADLASGDDDLFIAQAAKAYNTSICTNPKTFVYSEPKRSFQSLYRQKTRHYSTSTRYSPFIQLLLAGLSISQIGFWVSILMACWVLSPFLILSFVFLRFSIILLFWMKTLCIFEDRKLILYVLLLDVISPLYYLTFAPSLFFKQSSHWK